MTPQRQRLQAARRADWDSIFAGQEARTAAGRELNNALDAFAVHLRKIRTHTSRRHRARRPR